MSEGIYVTLNDLIRLQHKASGFTFLPRQPVHSLLAGRHASRLRGRGMDFEELRAYLPGDDIRSLDWKATQRTRRPYVRVYTEERERPVLLMVDQRLSMFFGTRQRMKSVTAAEAASLAAWRVVGAGDRVGAIVFNDTQMQEIKPRRSRRTVMQILQIIVAQNRKLGVDQHIQDAPQQLDAALQRVGRLAKHDCLVCIISDFYGLSGVTRRLVRQISRHNDVMLALVYDPIAKQLPDAGVLLIGDGKSQAVLDSGKAILRRRSAQILKGRLNTLTENLSRFGIPILPIHTAEGVAEQVRRALGYIPGKPLRMRKQKVRGSR